MTEADNGSGKPVTSREGVGSKLIAALLKDLGGNHAGAERFTGTKVEMEYNATSSAGAFSTACP